MWGSKSQAVSWWVTDWTTPSTIEICPIYVYSMRSDFGRYIDHTLLRPIATAQDVRRLCSEAIEHEMAAVCVFPSYVALSREVLRQSRVKIATVIAFPFGITFTEIKE